MCQTAAFRWLTCTILQDLPRFVAAHNEALGDYRRRHKLRNHAHPAPNLATDGPWLEAPLWVWSTDSPTRRPVFVRRDAGRVTLSDRHGWERPLPLEAGAGLGDAVAELASWEAAGIKLRSRALITTMFARLVLADLFIHGIGGGRYDEATDAISQRFFGIAPPPFAVLSGTLHLPIPHPPGDEGAVRALRRELRELDFHAERRLRLNSLSPADQTTARVAVASKRATLETEKTAQNAAVRHAAIVAANGALQPLIADQRQQTEANLAASIAQSRANRVLQWREYAFCLFPRRDLEQFLLEMGGCACRLRAFDAGASAAGTEATLEPSPIGGVGDPRSAARFPRSPDRPFRRHDMRARIGR